MATKRRDAVVDAVRQRDFEEAGRLLIETVLDQGINGGVLGCSDTAITA